MLTFTVEALYKRSHPEYKNYLYLVAPVNLIFLNPIAFIMMEISKQKSMENEEMQNRSIKGFGQTYERPGVTTVMKRVMKGVLLNPVIIMTALGIIGNLVFSHCVPHTLRGTLDVS